MRRPWLVSVTAAAVSITVFSRSAAAEWHAPAPAVAVAKAPAGEPPPDFCVEGYAHEMGYLANLQARLLLAPDQQPLWDRWQQKLQAAALAQQADCQAERARLGSKPNALQREDAFLRSTSARLDSIKASRPELEALYGAPTPAQQEVFDHLWPPTPPPPLPGLWGGAGAPPLPGIGLIGLP